MLTHFICFANSRKYGERCVAGIEVKANGDKGLNIIRENGNPKWIRPVTIKDHGQIDERLVKNISLLDLVKVEVRKEMKDSYQTENRLVDKYSFQTERHLPLKANHLDTLCSTNENLFGNNSGFISQQETENIHHSLMLIKVQDFETSVTVTPLKTKIKGSFIYHDVRYELPLTDVNFCNTLIKNSEQIRTDAEYYLTISLGVLFEEKHFKLIAGVIAA